MVSRIDLVKEVVENSEGLDKEGIKKQREQSGNIPEKERKASKIALPKRIYDRKKGSTSLLPLL